MGSSTTPRTWDHSGDTLAEPATECYRKVRRGRIFDVASRDSPATTHPRSPFTRHGTSEEWPVGRLPSLRPFPAAVRIRAAALFEICRAAEQEGAAAGEGRGVGAGSVDAAGFSMSCWRQTAPGEFPALTPPLPGPGRRYGALAGRGGPHPSSAAAPLPATPSSPRPSARGSRGNSVTYRHTATARAAQLYDGRA